MKVENDLDMIRLKKALSKTKWLEKLDPEEITIEKLESLCKQVSKKYPIHVAYIMNHKDGFSTAMIKNSKTNSWIETVYFQTFFELAAKSILVFYGYIVKQMDFKDTLRGALNED